MASDAMIEVGNWSFWTDQGNKWCAKGPDGNGGTVNQLEALLLDRIRDTIATAIAHIEERDRLKAELAEARSEYADLQEEHAEEVGAVCQAERQRIAGVLQELIALAEAEHPDRPSTIVLTLKTAIKAIEETTP